MNLDELAGRVPAREPRRVTVPMAEWWGDGAEVTFVEPSTATWFLVREDARRVREMRPGWPDDLANAVALLALCHEAPTPGKMSAGEFYVHLATNDSETFAALLGAFNAAWPHLRDLKGAGDSAKNG